MLLTPSGLAAVPAADAKQQLSAALARAYAAHEYVRGRRQHLALLESLGKNAWLVGNWQLEGEVRALERELGDAKRSVDLAAARRRAAQEAIAGELRGLEETWKKGVARVVETEAAAEVLRREVLEARRRNAKLID